MEIRKSSESDLAAILQIEQRAFGQDEGAEIVELVKGLLSDPSAMPLLSLLAIQDDETVGHILFYNAHLTAADASPTVAILAPMAVLPEAQSRGIGGPS